MVLCHAFHNKLFKETRSTFLKTSKGRTANRVSFFFQGIFVSVACHHGLCRIMN